MARRFEFETKVGDGPKAQSVGYSSKKRGDCLAVVFVDAAGKRVEKMTPCKRKDAHYHLEAAKLIARAYAPFYVTLSQIKWADALAEVERTSGDLRPATLTAFRVSVKGLRAVFESDHQLAKKPASPADVTPELASRFARLFLSTPYTRGKSAVQRKRTPVTLSYYLRSLSALWNQFRELGYVTANVWAEVRRPQLEKKQKYVPTEEDTARFFAWVTGRYPQWKRLHALLTVKLLSGCRTADIVQLKSDQLVDGQLVFKPSQTKTKAGRSVPLPAELFTALRTLAGKEWLWDGWNEEVKRFRPGRNPLPDRFQASTVSAVLNNIFREYSDSHPDRPRFSPHALRRRAITVMVTATQSVDLTAQALGVNAQTARTYYLDAQRAFNTADAFRIATGLLLPNAKAGAPAVPAIPPLTANDAAQSGTDANNEVSQNTRKT